MDSKTERIDWTLSYVKTDHHAHLPKLYFTQTITHLKLGDVGLYGHKHYHGSHIVSWWCEKELGPYHFNDPFKDPKGSISW